MSVLIAIVSGFTSGVGVQSFFCRHPVSTISCTLFYAIALIKVHTRSTYPRLVAIATSL